MKIDSVASNSVNFQNSNVQGERIVRAKGAEKADLPIKKVSNEVRTDVNLEDSINTEMLDNAVEQANKTLGSYNKYIERFVHDKTHTIMYVLRDSETNEIIREFPPKKIQDMIAKMWEIAGILVDERR
ncbi:MAG: flagellar protein FlaG [Clostridiaceae bacterium]|nr:flagellar protein FlaG [Clostridiaceae bacterium]